MIRVTIELWPGGDESARSTLGTMDIALVGKEANGAIGQYAVVLHKHPPYFDTDGVYRRGTIKRFPRSKDGGPTDVRAGGPYDLTYWALHACGYDNRRKVLLGLVEERLREE